MPYNQFQITEQPHHYTVTSTRTTTTNPKGQHLFPENSPFDTSQPDLRMHIGPDTTGPVIGASKYKRFSQDCQISLFENEADTEINPENAWKNINLSKKGYLSPSYVFQARLYGEMSHFSWKKTKSIGKHATPLGNLKLVDGSSGEVLAVYSSESYTLVHGLVEMCRKFGEEFDRLALLTGVSVREEHLAAGAEQADDGRHGNDYVFTAGVAGVGGGGMGGGC